MVFTDQPSLFAGDKSSPRANVPLVPGTPASMEGRAKESERLLLLLAVFCPSRII